MKKIQMNNMTKKKPKKKDGRLQKGEKKGRVLNPFSFCCFFEIIFWEG
jgi:hypothetical protein